MKYIIAVLLVLMTAGCRSATAFDRSQADSNSVPAAESMSEGETGMESQEMVQQLEDLFGCSERTAQALYEKLERAISGGIAQIEEEPCEYFRILKLTDCSGQVFYAKITTGYFLSEVHADTLDGERIYQAIP